MGLTKTSVPWNIFIATNRNIFTAQAPPTPPVLSQREREFLNDLKAFRDDYRLAGGRRVLGANEERFVRAKLDHKYGSRYVTVLRNRIRRRASKALDDLLEIAMVDADDPTAGTLLRPLLPPE
jgi:hypothetical protein